MSQGPDDARSLNAQGNARKEAGDLQGAAALYHRAVQAEPGYSAPLYNLGLVWRELGRADDAEACFRQAAEIDPRDSDARIHLAALAEARSSPSEAAAWYEAALRLVPANAALWAALGTVRGAMGDWTGARECLDKALRQAPDELEIHIRVGSMLLDAGSFRDAVDHGRAALRRWPDCAELHNNLGCALLQEGRTAEAADSFRAAIASRRDLANAHLNLGDLFARDGDYERARDSYAAGMQARPDEPAFVDRLLFAKQHLCEWSGFDELCERRRRNVRELPRHLTPPFSLLSIPSTPAEQLVCARSMSERISARTAGDRLRLSFKHDRDREARPRVGYLSADFHAHVTAYVIAEMLALHDASSFEIFAYSYGPRSGGALRDRASRAVEHFVEVGGLSDAEAASRVHDDGIDILVDLNGYTQGARTEILAMRPAPIQVNYVGFPGTMGADFIDYVIVDRFLTEREETVQGFSERIVALPGCYVPIDRKRSVAPTPSRAELGLPEKAVVFCCFNQRYKILPDLFASWMRILDRVPEGVLWLLESNAAASRNLADAAARHGIAPQRLIFSPRTPPDRYLARLRVADLFLDTYPYNAHTTAADALWVGLPVLTKAGETFASRVAGSMLSAAGMPELITHSDSDYEDLAVRLAGDPQGRVALRARLAEARSSARLFDTERFTRSLENAYRRMLDLRQRGQGPQAIDV